MRKIMKRQLRCVLGTAANLRRLRNAMARAVVDPTGAFATRVKPSARLYRRRPKHSARAFAEQAA